MGKRILKAWAIGLAISALGLALTFGQGDPQVLGLILSIPGTLITDLISVPLPFAVNSPSGRVSRAAMVWVFILVGFLGSVFYGALAFILLWLRRRHAAKVAREAM